MRRLSQSVLGTEINRSLHSTMGDWSVLQFITQLWRSRLAFERIRIDTRAVRSMRNTTFAHARREHVKEVKVCRYHCVIRKALSHIALTRRFSACRQVPYGGFEVG